jgi:hypothetical protein
MGTLWGLLETNAEVEHVGTFQYQKS